MIIDGDFLSSHRACDDGLHFAIENNLVGMEDVDFIKALAKKGEIDWAFWTLYRVLDEEDGLLLAQHAVELAIDNEGDEDARRIFDRIGTMSRKCLKQQAIGLYTNTQRYSDAQSALHQLFSRCFDVECIVDDAVDGGNSPITLEVLEYGLGVLQFTESRIYV